MKRLYRGLTALFTAGLIAGTAVPAWAQQQSFVFDVGGIATALNESQRTIGGKTLPAIKPVNAFQKQIVTFADKYNAELRKHLSGEELKVFASFDPAKINADLKNAGSRIQVEFTPPDEFAVVSILDVAPKFVVPGEIGTTDQATGKMTYFSVEGKPAFRMKVGTHHIGLRRFPDKKEPLVVLTAKNGDQILLMKTDVPPLDFPAKEASAKLMRLCAENCADTSRDYLGAIIPMVDIDQDVDISNLKGLEYAGTRWFVSQAKQQVRFAMDPNGVSVKTETVIVNTSRSLLGGPTYYQLTGSFYAVVIRPGMTVPYFSGFVGTDDRRVPASYRSRLPADYPFK